MENALRLRAEDLFRVLCRQLRRNHTPLQLPSRYFHHVLAEATGRGMGQLSLTKLFFGDKLCT
jgi:hypothetical protein